MKKTKLMAAIAAATMAVISMAATSISASATTRVPYMLGDVDNDYVIEVEDCIEVMSALSSHGFEDGMKVNVLFVQRNLSDWFPNAVCAASADVDKDGYISYEDARAILQHYANASACIDDGTDIGKLFLYITD